MCAQIHCGLPFCLRKGWLRARVSYPQELAAMGWEGELKMWETAKRREKETEEGERRKDRGRERGRTKSREWRRGDPAGKCLSHT